MFARLYAAHAEPGVAVQYTLKISDNSRNANWDCLKHAVVCRVDSREL